MFYDQLLHADPGAFDEAASAFTSFEADVRDRALDYNQQVLKHLNDEDTWRGEAAHAAKVPSGDLQLALNRAADQLDAVPDILRDHVGRLSELKTRLKGIVANAREAGIQVQARAEQITVTAPADLKQRSKDAGWPDPEDAVLEDIRTVLNEATELDTDTADKLRAALTAESLDAHVVGADYRDAVKDAKRAAELLKQLSHDAPFDEAKRKELEALLKEHGDDPEFAATLLNRLGGKGTMEALKWVTVLGNSGFEPYGHEPASDAELKALQKQLGGVLALGTDPESAFHVDTSEDSKWMREFMAAGRSRLGGEYGDPYGYQILGATLHAGKYSAEFLNAVGDDMVDMEHDNPDVFKEFNPTRPKLWDLNFIDDVGAGRDPINGLMMAMERDQDAATLFFDPANDESNGYSRIDYLLDRDDWTDSEWGPGEKARSSDSSQSLVIDAISTATDGAQPGSSGYDIADETIDHLGAAGEGLNNDSARQSMSHLLAGQINNVHESFHGGAGGFNEGALSRVLGDVAHSPEGYANLANAERAYTAIEMERILDQGGDPSDIRNDLGDHAAQMGKVTAHLDSGKADAIHGEWSERQDDYNRRVNAVGLLGGYALEKAVGAIPGVDLLAGVAVDDIMDSAKVDYSHYAEADAARLYDKDRVLGVDMAEQLIWERGLYEADTSPPKELFRDGRPIPLADMTERQVDVYFGWKSRDDAYSGGAQQTLDDIRDAYHKDWVAARQSQRGGR